uniref:Ig-like domain-containing protein n=1 Tax=Steinernema glaseri TaxID=37863 RepID=A0A1I8A2W3_9BILA
MSTFLLLWTLNGTTAKRKHLPCKKTAYDRHTTNYRSWREQMTVCELLEGYDHAVRPTGRTPYNEKKGPVVISTSLYINSISAVSERNMEFVAQFKFQQEWYDDRLRFVDDEFRNFDFIHVSRDQKLWIPDTFFQNERNGWYHMLDQENRYVKVRSDGKVFYNRRLTLTLACNMDLLRYPMDVQECLIDFASYAYTTNDIIYEWDEIGIAVDDGANGALPNFAISSYKNSTCHSVTNTGAYSCLRVELELSRVFSFFLLQLYIPSAMLVGVSWVSYWIDWKSTAARVPLAIVTLLTMITQSHAINSNLPPVSYTKAIDVWIGACVVFIFASLIEYAVVNYMGILDEHREMRKVTSNRTRLSNVIDRDMQLSTGQNPAPTPAYSWDIEKRSLLRMRRKLSFQMQVEEQSGMELSDLYVPSRELLRDYDQDWTFQMDTTDMAYVGQRKRVELVRWCSLLSSRGRAERIDIVARLIFPIAFMMFNFAYWSIYLKEASDKA